MFWLYSRVTDGGCAFALKALIPPTLPPQTVIPTAPQSKSCTTFSVQALRSVPAMRLMALSHCSCPDCSDPAGAPAESLCCMQLDSLSTCTAWVCVCVCVCRCVWECAKRAYLRVWLFGTSQTETLTFPYRRLKDALSWAQTFNSHF